MSQRALAWALVPAALLAAAAADARGWHHHGHSGVTQDGGGITRCADWRVEFGDRDAAIAEQSATIPVSDAAPLVATSSENGGATIVGYDGKDFEITLCKAVPDDDRTALERIRLVRDKGRLSVDGPSDGDWTAHLIIRAPKNASVNVETANGPVDVSDFSGTAAISSENGPVSLRRSSGSLEVRTTNGPIAFDGGSGKVRLDAENGPLTVRLREGEWRGGTFEGRTRNGPLDVEISETYGSGVLVQTDGHSPFHCGAEACRNARRSWDDDSRSIAFGPDKAVVTLSTHNGPVSISD